MKTRRKLLCCTDLFHPPFGKSLRTGGGGKSLYLLLSMLKDDFDIHVLSFNNAIPEGTFERNGLILKNANYPELPKFGQITEWLRNRKQTRLLRTIIYDLRPDIIMGQRYAISAAVSEGHKRRIPTIALVRSYENIYSYKDIIPALSQDFRLVKDNSYRKVFRSIRDNLEYSFANSLKKQYTKAIKTADAVVANSQFMANLINDIFKVTPHIVYPLIDFSEYKTDTWQPKYVTFLGANLPKGIEIFIRIAAILKDIPFLCVGNLAKPHEEKVKELDNVQYSSWTGNMKAVYAKTKILLAPVLWPEPFGRLTVEAMLNKIPCIVSRRGGLPEAVGDAGIVIDDPNDIQSWVNSILYLWESPDVYEDLSRKSYEKAKLFDPKGEYAKFADILKRLSIKAKDEG